MSDIRIISDEIISPLHWESAAENTQSSRERHRDIAVAEVMHFQCQFEIIIMAAFTISCVLMIQLRRVFAIISITACKYVPTDWRGYTYERNNNWSVVLCLYWGWWRISRIMSNNISKYFNDKWFMKSNVRLKISTFITNVAGDAAYLLALL